MIITQLQGKRCDVDSRTTTFDYADAAAWWQGARLRTEQGLVKMKTSDISTGPGEQIRSPLCC